MGEAKVSEENETLKECSLKEQGARGSVWDLRAFRNTSLLRGDRASLIHMMFKWIHSVQNIFSDYNKIIEDHNFFLFLKLALNKSS